MELFRSRVSQYRSSRYEVARGVLRSRNKQRKRAQSLALRVSELEEANRQLNKQLGQAQTQIGQQNQILSSQRQEIEELREQSITLPTDLPLPNHSFGPKMIALCMNLAQKIGFRPTEAALKIVFDHLNIQAKIPSWSSIRCWTCRAGVAQLETPFGENDDVLWMTDHSNQIGSEKVLTIIGIRVDDLPPPGKTLRMEDVKVLAVVPGTKWKREDVREEYRKLAERIGPPRYLLCDGAIELWEPVDVLEKAGQKPVTLGDMKHHAANVLEKLVGRSERFTSFLTQVGLTRNRIQQTELGHFVPPPLKQKSRFMNLGPLLCWGQMVSHHLSRPRSAARQGIDVARMNEKLGWLREYRKDLASWSRCQAVIQTTLEFVNRQGLYRGLADQLHTLLKDKASSWSMRCQASDEMIEKLVDHVSKSESLLAEGQRSWLSTEILESLFGCFKQLEGQHSKGGFTSLLAGLPSLTITWTADRVRASLQSVSVDQMKAWVEQALGRTLTSRRAEAYREFASATFG